MSIWASTVVFVDDFHADGCRRLVQRRDGVWEENRRRRCTCDCGPIAYQGSHVMPSERDRRAGRFDLAEIPGYVRSEPGGELEPPPYPWLRVGACERGGGDAVVLLDRDQVAQVHAYLTDWLERTEGGGS